MDTSLFDGNLVQSNRIIYTPSDFAKANFIHVQEVGELRARKPHTSQRKNLASYLFFMVLAGEGKLTYGGRDYALHAGDCVCVDCRKDYAHSCAETLWTLKWVHFYGPNVSAIYGKYLERGGKPVFTPADGGAFERVLDRIYEIAASQSYIKDMQIYEQLTALLALLMRQTIHGEDGLPAQASDGQEQDNPRYAGKRQNLQALKEYLDEHYAEKITLDALAEHFFINKFYLTRIFKEQFGESVTEYLLQVRITRAKQMLRFTDQSIEEIAHACGMHDANYFSRVFKRVEGTSPGEFRKVW
ncbi:MAG: helix-turn-helix domain-containing protein [Lachnospiraceae bacterium]|nr:helix-turn-helix domain-containing protein [Lachnospiraceae bacterium]